MRWGGKQNGYTYLITTVKRQQKSNTDTAELMAHRKIDRYK